MSNPIWIQAPPVDGEVVARVVLEVVVRPDGKEIYSVGDRTGGAYGGRGLFATLVRCLPAIEEAREMAIAAGEEKP